MRRAFQLTIGFLLLLSVALQPNPPRPVYPSHGTPVVSWTALREGMDAQTRWLETADAQSRWFEAATSQAVSVRVVAPARYGTGACGGDLPPCSVMWCESHGSLTAQNPHSTASGKWQILDSTWGGYGGYSRAMYAPEEVQDERARQIYAGGAGRSQWVC